VQLTGNELIPTLTKGVLFAQATMYRPASAPTVTAAAASQQSWLYYSTGDGFYWKNSKTPNASDDAFIGWVRTNANQIIAISSRKIGTGEEARVVPGGPVVVTIGATASGDTGPPAPAPGFAADVFPGAAENTPGRLWLGNIGFFQGTNLAGIDALTFLLYYVDELAGAAALLTADIDEDDTTLEAGAVITVATPGSVTFTFYAATHGGIVIGPGYAHNITIGEARYTYVQQVEDTAAMVAAALAEAIDAMLDPHATAEADGSDVVLTPLETSDEGIACTASDGNAPATLAETQPTYILVGEEILKVTASVVVGLASTLTVVRGAKGSVAAAHSAWVRIWIVQMMARRYAVSGALLGTTAWPVTIDEVPFRGKGLVAADCWASNEFGNSPVGEFCYATGRAGGRLRALSGGQLDLTVSGVLAIGADVAPAVTTPQAVSLRSITATVKNAPTGAGITVALKTPGWGINPFATLTIADGETEVVMDMTTTPGVDGMYFPAGQAVTVDVTGVGTTYPGAGLTVSMKF
jgi:hypothetical protein